MFTRVCRFCLSMVPVLVAVAMMLPVLSSGPTALRGTVAEPGEFSPPPPLAVPTELEVRRALLSPRSIQPLSPAHITPDILWLARAMYSESKRPQEQELVAWVIRNRLDTGYLGAESIRDVVLAPFQFSAFRPSHPQAAFHTDLSLLYDEPGWQRTLALAYFVTHADCSLRPFGPTVRHFISPQSMPEDQDAPEWMADRVPVEPSRAFELDAERFRFFADVD
ncbi:MAG: cell wall hydrolase [Bacteroidota bacterium]|nr:cell wall hydrolase [Bacteroidota bacterium]